MHTLEIVYWIGKIYDDNELYSSAWSEVKAGTYIFEVDGRPLQKYETDTVGFRIDNKYSKVPITCTIERID